ncbi:ThuA domain-containing protein [Mycetocola tolaasinivorans]|nr:ThuA domain-containing protein [Mycetocola tolaasinivorans]
MTRVTLFSAIAPFDDPWHNFAITSDELEKMLTARGFEVERPGTVAELPAALERADLFVANCSADQFEEAAEFAAFETALAGLLERGGSVLSMHASLLAFQAVPLWEKTLGCRWNHPVSMHPQKGWSLIQFTAEEHPISAGFTPFSLYDERYSRLALLPGNTTLAFHTMEGETHPLLWTREVGSARIVVDALGHGLESFDSPEHRELIERSLTWLVPGSTPLNTSASAAHAH